MVRFYKGHNSVVEWLVTASLLSMHKRIATTDFDGRLVAMVIWKSLFTRQPVVMTSFIISLPLKFCNLAVIYRQSVCN